MSTGLKKLQDALGDVVLTDDDSLFKASFDGMKLAFQPQAVVRVTEEDQVGVMLKLANEHNVPVTTRGAGSSLTGSATPIKGGWVLDLTKLVGLKIDPLNRMAHADAGVITETLQQMAAGHGLFYPPDPSSKKFCTIGGNIACNAGGLKGVKYGVTRDYVVSLRGFLPTGEKVTWGRPLKKYMVGYNLRDLWIGSEGTLGVVTHAILKLIPAPKVTWTALAAFKDEKEALGAARAIIEMGVTPSILEFLDRLTVMGAEQSTGQVFEQSGVGQSLLLIELDGHPGVVDEEKAQVLQWAKKYADKFVQAETADEAQALWRIRRECSSAMFQHGDAKLNEDIVVPLQHGEALVRFVQKLSEDCNLKIPTFGHAGDGNFHVNIMYHRDNPEECKKAEEAVQSLMEEVVKLGGAISGEHGIGLAKSPFLRLQLCDSEVAAMQSIKKSLDPKGILNPGKIFEPFAVWEHKAIAYKMPWDH